MSLSKKVRKDMGQDSWIRRMMDEAIKLRKQYKDEEIFGINDVIFNFL